MEGGGGEGGDGEARDKPTTAAWRKNLCKMIFNCVRRQQTDSHGQTRHQNRGDRCACSETFLTDALIECTHCDIHFIELKEEKKNKQHLEKTRFNNLIRLRNTIKYNTIATRYRVAIPRTGPGHVVR